MAITKVRQLDSVLLLPNGVTRVRVQPIFADTADSSEASAQNGIQIDLDPSKPAHATAIAACQAAWNAVFTLAGATR